MGKFDDLVSALRNPGDDGIPETIYDDLTVEYNTLLQGSSENSKQKDAELEHLNGEVSRLKSANYDLLTKVSTGEDAITPEDGTDDEDDVPDINSLFTKRK